MNAAVTNCPSVYELYGLRIHSEVTLSAPLCHNAFPDLNVRWGESRPIPDIPPAGEVLAKLSYGNGHGYSLTETGAGYTLRFNEVCEFRIAPDLCSIHVHLAPHTDPDIASLLLAGNVIAFVLALTGEHALHASAVEVGGAALAFVGASGMGKSTLAALLCANGARLITDDLLRLAPEGDGFRCFPGSPEIRLRPAAAVLAQHFPAAVAKQTVDERLAIRPENSSNRMPPLRAVVIPRPSRTCHSLHIAQLTPPKALFYLMGYSRITGWQASEPLRCQFHRFKHVARNIPVFEAEIPWGPPFARELSTALLRNVGFDGGLTKVAA